MNSRIVIVTSGLRFRGTKKDSQNVLDWLKLIWPITRRFLPFMSNEFISLKFNWKKHNSNESELPQKISINHLLFVSEIFSMNSVQFCNFSKKFHSVTVTTDNCTPHCHIHNFLKHLLNANQPTTVWIFDWILNLKQSLT